MTTTTLSTVQRRIREIKIPPVYAILVVVFVSAVVLDMFFGRGQITSSTILTNMLVRSVALGIVAMGQTFVMLAASIDLSVAYLISVTAVMASFLMRGDPSRVPMAVAAVFAIGAFVGLTTGLVVSALRVNPFIATPGVGLVLKGVLNASFETFIGAVPRSFQTLVYGTVGPVPISILVLLAVTVAAAFVIKRTRFGAHLYAVGGSEEVARLSGLRTDRVII